MLLKQFLSKAMQNFTYLLADENSKEAVIIDPSQDTYNVIDFVKQNNLKVIYIINTHGHFDHTMGNESVIRETQAKVVAYKSAQQKTDKHVIDGDLIRVGNIELKVIHTPGHSPDSICLLTDNKLFSGDTLFVGECGRTDLPGSSPEDMYDSLLGKISKLPDDTEVYPGHDYGSKPSSTIGYDKTNYYTLKWRKARKSARGDNRWTF